MSSPGITAGRSVAVPIIVPPAGAAVPIMSTPAAGMLVPTSIPSGTTVPAGVLLLLAARVAVALSIGAGVARSSGVVGGTIPTLIPPVLVAPAMITVVAVPPRPPSVPRIVAPLLGLPIKSTVLSSSGGRRAGLWSPGDHTVHGRGGLLHGDFFRTLVLVPRIAFDDALDFPLPVFSEDDVKLGGAVVGQLVKFGLEDHRRDLLAAGKRRGVVAPLVQNGVSR